LQVSTVTESADEALTLTEGIADLMLHTALVIDPRVAAAALGTMSGALEDRDE